MLFQKRVVRTKFDIYAFTTITVPSSQCYGTDMVYYIFFYYLDLQFLYNVSITKIKVFLWQA